MCYSADMFKHVNGDISGTYVMPKL